ncbi:hypothetical protein [Candidatus Hodgkinia cicadicola]
MDLILVGENGDLGWTVWWFWLVMLGCWVVRMYRGQLVRCGGSSLDKCM